MYKEKKIKKFNQLKQCTDTCVDIESVNETDSIKDTINFMNLFFINFIYFIFILFFIYFIDHKDNIIKKI